MSATAADQMLSDLEAERDDARNVGVICRLYVRSEFRQRLGMFAENYARGLDQQIAILKKRQELRRLAAMEVGT